MSLDLDRMDHNHFQRAMQVQYDKLCQYWQRRTDQNTDSATSYQRMVLQHVRCIFMMAGFRKVPDLSTIKNQDKKNGNNQDKPYQLPQEILKQVLMRILQNYQRLPQDVVVSTLQHLSRFGLNDSAVSKDVLDQLGRKSLLYDGHDTLQWSMLCVTAFQYGHHDHLCTVADSWCQILWVLTDPPVPQEPEPDFIMDDRNWKSLVDFLINKTPPALSGVPFCRKSAILGRGKDDDTVCLFHAMCLAMQFNGSNAKSEGWKHVIQLDNTMQKKKTEKPKEEPKEPENQTAINAKSSAWVSTKPEKIEATANKQGEKKGEEETNKHYPLRDDAYDRRLERLCYIATQLIQHKTVTIGPELGYKCSTILLRLIHRLQHKTFIHFQYPRRANQRLSALLRLL